MSIQPAHKCYTAPIPFKAPHNSTTRVVEYHGVSLASRTCRAQTDLGIRGQPFPCIVELSPYENPPLATNGARVGSKGRLMDTAAATEKDGEL